MLDKDDDGKFLNRHCAERATTWTRYCYNDNEDGKVRRRYFDYTPVGGTCNDYIDAKPRNACKWKIQEWDLNLI